MRRPLECAAVSVPFAAIAAGLIADNPSDYLSYLAAGLATAIAVAACLIILATRKPVEG